MINVSQFVLNRMKTIVAVAVLTGAMSLSSFGQMYVAGDFNGWNSSGNAMTETSSGSGIWQVSLTGLAASTRQEFKITDGTWTSPIWTSGSWPNSGNSWLYSDANGDVTITYDANTYSDGWMNTSDRIGVNVDPGAWTAVGDWQGWNNTDPTTAMTSMGGGIYEYQQIITAANTYQYKAVNTGTWDAIGADARGINADNLSFTTTAPDQLATFKVDALNGTIQVTVVPEPASLALLGVSGLIGLIFARKRALV